MKMIVYFLIRQSHKVVIPEVVHPCRCQESSRFHHGRASGDVKDSTCGEVILFCKDAVSVLDFMVENEGFFFLSIKGPKISLHQFYHGL